MTETKHTLIQRSLDGELSEEEMAALESALASDDDARRTLEDLRAMERSLDELTLVEPPADLRRRIMRSLRSGFMSQGTDSIRTFIQDAWSALGGRPRLAYGYAFALGLAVGLSLLLVLQGDTPSEEDLYATMMRPEQAPDSLTDFEATYELAGFVADVRTYSTGALLVLDVEVDADLATDVHIILPEGLTLKSLIRKTGAGSPEIQTDQGRVQLTIAGADRYTLLFNRPPQTAQALGLEFWRGGEQLFADVARTGT